MAEPAQNANDQLPAPQPEQAPAAPPAAAAPQTGSTSSLIQINPPTSGLSGNEIIIGAGVTLVLTVLFWFVGKIITDSLVKQFAEVGAARRAGTSFFIFLTLLGACATFGFLGHLWQTLFFVVPAGLLVGIMFLVALFSLIAANGSKKNR